MKRISTLGILGSLLLIASAPDQAWAPARRPAIQYCALVLHKLEPINPPSYPNEVLTNRDGLIDAVAGVLDIMTDPTEADPTAWCSPIADIFTLATATTAYFDISAAPNPALDDFRRDWNNVRRLAECPPF
jgi:hypothetical protein